MAPNKSKVPGRRLGWPSLPTAIAYSALLLFGGLLVVSFYFRGSSVSGSELNTDNWTVRTFQYRRDPFSQRQSSGVVRNTPSPLNASIGNTFPGNFLVRKNNVPPRWDLVYIQDGGKYLDGPAGVLTAYFLSSQSDFWVNWNKQNPVKAKALWQAVKDLVDLGQYCDLPPVMDLTTLKCADDEFVQLLREVMFASLQEKKALLGLPADPQIVELVDKLLLVYPKTPAPLTP